MRTIALGDYEATVQGGPLAVVLYKRLFSKDFYDDYNDAIKPGDEDGGLTRIDPIFLLQAIYAMAKCANEADSELPKTAKTFDEFLKSMPDLAMPVNPPWGMEVINAISAELFRFDLEAVIGQLGGESEPKRRANGRKNARGSQKAGVQPA